MDKNNLIGFLLLSVLMVLYFKFSAPVETPINDNPQNQIEQVENEVGEPIVQNEKNQSVLPVLSDSIQYQQEILKYGDFAPVFKGVESIVSLKNDKFVVNVNTKGGQLSSVELLGYKKESFDSMDNNSVMNPLLLLNDSLNRLEFLLPLNGVLSNTLNTSDMYFEPSLNGNDLTLTAKGLQGNAIIQSYHINDDYTIDFDIKVESTKGFKAKNASFEWIDYLDKIERSVKYEKMYASVSYKEVGENPTSLSYTSDDEEVLNAGTEWIAHSNQFFSSVIVAEKPFANAKVSVSKLDEGNPNLKEMQSSFDISTNELSQGYKFKWYIGPNKFENLMAFDNGMENIIPFGWSIFGTINRWVVRPIFNFFSSLVGNAGLAILLLTFCVKLLVFPLMYKMLYSQSKMQALKPKIEAMKKKLGDDKQAVSVETMKLYREYGTSPFGGCLPQLLQLPLWFALYRFFPASIDFRQQGFLWATDLSTYDVFAHLPFEVPFYGTHVSMFTILWAVGTLIFSYYNSKHMDFTANPSMKYMQYAMPVMFLFFFNSYASGLTLYLFFGVVFNILQTYVTKNILIDQNKLALELEEYKSKPKKKGGFAAKLESAMAQQKAIAEEKNKKNKK